MPTQPWVHSVAGLFSNCSSGLYVHPVPRGAEIVGARAVGSRVGARLVAGSRASTGRVGVSPPSPPLAGPACCPPSRPAWLLGPAVEVVPGNLAPVCPVPVPRALCPLDAEPGAVCAWPLLLGDGYTSFCSPAGPGRALAHGRELAGRLASPRLSVALPPGGTPRGAANRSQL